MNPLLKWFNETESNKASKWSHYFDIYDFWFNRYRNKQLRMLEIGIWNGGSLQMWKHYFGEQAQIVGLDINPQCKKFEEQQIEVVIGDQTDIELLKSLGEFDIILDDGGHTMSQQLTSFVTLYNQTKNDGIYMVEDTHTSYMPDYIDQELTFIDYAKASVDKLHDEWHGNKTMSGFGAVTKGVHFYDSIVVFEKNLHDVPEWVDTPKATRTLDNI